MFPGEGDPAMHLDAFLGHQLGRVADQVLGGADMHFPCVGCAVEMSGEVDNRRPRLFDFDQHIGHAVLQRLEFPDGLAELFAGFQIVRGQFPDAFHQAQRLGANRQRGAGIDLGDCIIGTAFGPQTGSGTKPDILEQDLGGLTARNQGIAAQSNAVDTGGADLGRIHAVHNHGGGDLLELRAKGRKGTVLVPFTRAVVPTVDLGAGRIVIDPPEGLLDIEEP